MNTFQERGCQLPSPFKPLQPAEGHEDGGARAAELCSGPAGPITVLGDAARAGTTAQAAQGPHWLLCDSVKEPSAHHTGCLTTSEQHPGGPACLWTPPRLGLSSGQRGRAPVAQPWGLAQTRLDRQQRFNTSHLGTRPYHTPGEPPAPPDLCPCVGASLKRQHPHQGHTAVLPMSHPVCPLLFWLTDWRPGGLQTCGGVGTSSPAPSSTRTAALLSAVPDLMSLCLRLLMNLLSPPFFPAPGDGAYGSEDTAGVTPTQQPSSHCSPGAHSD